MSTTIPTRFRVRRDAAANWTTVNPVLLLGEPALETDTGRVKYGDGVTAWTMLPYAAGSVLSPNLEAITSLASAGLIVRGGPGTAVVRAVTGTAGAITVTNGDGVSGNPTVGLAPQISMVGKTVTGGLHLVGPTFDRSRFERSGVGSWYLGNPSASGTGNSFSLLVNATTAWEANTSGGFSLPNHGTTASGANAYIDPSNGLVSRSTSSLQYKREVEDMDPAHADKLLDLRTIWYRSAIETDPQNWSWWGVAAEELAKLDPRLVHWGYAEDDYDKRCKTTRRKLRKHAKLRPVGVAYDRMTVPLLNLVQRLEGRIADLEAKLETIRSGCPS